MKRFILASGSPRRKELIKKLNLNFKIMPSRYEEELDNRHFSYEKIEKLAYDKALEVANRLPESAIIVGAVMLCTMISVSIGIILFGKSLLELALKYFVH